MKPQPDDTQQASHPRPVNPSLAAQASGSGLAERLVLLAAAQASDSGSGPLPEALAAPLDQILTEVDGIMLPRQVVVFVGMQPVAQLVVAQRRLVGLSLADGWRGDLLGGMRRLLQLCGKGPLRFQRRSTQAPIVAESLSAAQIRQQLMARPLRAGLALAQLADLVAPICVACLGPEGAGSGAAADLALLRDLEAEGDRSDPVGARPQAWILPATARRPGHKVLVARADRLRVLALFPTPALTQVGAAWQQVFDRS